MFDRIAFRYYFRVLLLVFAAGVMATLSMDLWNEVLNVTSGVGLDWHMLGRWVLDLMSGDFIFRHVMVSPVHAHDSIIGWLAHYATGIVYAYIYFLVVLSLFHKRNTYLHAVVFSLCFMFMPFLIYQPAMGMGYFASHAAHPDKARLFTISFHVAFG